MTRRALAVLPVLFLLALPILADEVYLNCGKCIRGKITAEHEAASGEERTTSRDSHRS